MGMAIVVNSNNTISNSNVSAVFYKTEGRTSSRICIISVKVTNNVIIGSIKPKSVSTICSKTATGNRSTAIIYRHSTSAANIKSRILCSICGGKFHSNFCAGGKSKTCAVNSLCSSSSFSGTNSIVGFINVTNKFIIASIKPKSVSTISTNIGLGNRSTVIIYRPSVSFVNTKSRVLCNISIDKFHSNFCAGDIGKTWAVNSLCSNSIHLAAISIVGSISITLDSYSVNISSSLPF